MSFGHLNIKGKTLTNGTLLDILLCVNEELPLASFTRKNSFEFPAHLWRKGNYKNNVTGWTAFEKYIDV